MYKKIISTTILFVILFTSMFVYASSNQVEIEYSTKHTLIQRDKTKLYLEFDKPLEFRVNEDTFIFPKDKSEVLKSFSIEFLEGKKTTDDLKTTIENGLILIETNLGDILLDDEGIFFYNEDAYKIGEKLETKGDYKLKFKEEFKRLVEIKNSTENMDSKLTDLEYEIKELKKEILKKEASQTKDQDFHKEELEFQIKALEKELMAERNKKPNVSSSGSTSYSEQTVQPNIYRAKGSLQVIGEIPKSFEDLKQDIFLELARVDSAGDHEIFYLSGNNGFKNTNQLGVGDYFVKSIYFLDSSLKDKYEFHHNNMVKVLDNETTYFNLSLTETDPVLENLLFEEDREDRGLYSLIVFDDEPSKYLAFSRADGSSRDWVELFFKPGVNDLYFNLKEEPKTIKDIFKRDYLYSDDLSFKTKIRVTNFNPINSKLGYYGSLIQILD